MGWAFAAPVLQATGERHVGRCSVCAQAGRDSVVWTEFRRWFSENGGVYNKVDLHWFDGVRGLSAVEDIQDGEVIIRVPRELLVSARGVAQDANFDDFYASEMRGKPQQYIIAAWLLTEKQQAANSRFAPYTNLLPDLVQPVGECVPLDFWDQEQLAKLEFPLLDELRRSRDKFLRQTYDAVGPQQTRRLAQFTLAELRAALAIAYSRMFHAPAAPGTQDGDDCLLVPVADMLNHRNPEEASTRKFFDENGDFVVQARVPVAKGDEVTTSYGKLPNPHLLQSNGFTLRSNPYDFAVVDAIELVGSLESDDVRRQFLAEGLLLPTPEGSVSRWQPLSRRLAAACDAARARGLLSSRLLAESSRSSDLVDSMVHMTLSSFKSTLQGDVELLGELEGRADLGVEGACALHAARIRRTQKLLLGQHLAVRSGGA